MADMPYLVQWNYVDDPDAKLPFGLSMVIEPSATHTMASPMQRLHWLEVAMQTGNISDDWDVEDGYFIWHFKTESARTYFMVATSGEGDNEPGVSIRWF